MRERPLLMSGPMVRAILEDRKTQTRRVVTGDKPGFALDLLAEGFTTEYVAHEENGLCPYGVAGDRLWVREAWTKVPATAYRMSEGVHQTVNPTDPDQAAIYAAGWDRSIPKWRPSIHMPRWACRLVLELTDVRVERLQDISEDDARAEGCPVTWDGKPYDPPPPEVDSWQGYGRYSFCLLWNSINGKRPGCTWDDNPWVWVLGFKRVAA